MADNQFLPFGVADGANVLSHDDYKALPARTNGFGAGVAKSVEVNTPIRQSTVMSSALGQFIADRTGKDVLDDGDVAALLTSLQDALKSQISDTVPAASTTIAGITKLSSATNSNDETMAATPRAVKSIADRVSTLNVKTVNAKSADANGNIQITSSDIFNTQAIAIGGGADLNTYTIPALYYQPANAQAGTGKNYPEANAGSLEVYKHAGISQIYRIYNSSRSYIRSLYGGAWSAWTKQYDTANKPTAADVGALPSGGTAVAATKLATARTINGVAFNGTANITISASSVGSYTKAESDGRYPLKTATVIGARVGARGTLGSGNGDIDIEAPVGNYITGRVGSNGDVRYTKWYIRALQINVNGTWKTITA